MSQLPYEILLRWKDDGTFSGGHTIRRDSITGQLSDAKPIGVDKTFPWPIILGEVNTGLVEKASSADALQASLDSAKEDKATLLQDIASAVRDPNTPTDSAVLAILTDASKDERQKIIDDATAEIARLQAVIANEGV